MAWRISNGQYLIYGRSYPIYLAASTDRVRLWDGTLINSASEYLQVSPHGEVLGHYGSPWTTTIEDMLCVSGIHVVLELALYECYWEQRCFKDGELRRRVLLEDLRAIPTNALPFSAPDVVERFHLPGGTAG
jgi:hypothetical protein